VAPGLDGRVAIVTGAAGGIGEAVVHALAGAGATVLGADLEGERLRRLAGDLPAGCAIALDVADPRALERAAAAAVDAHGRLDILVNAAGIVSRSAALDVTPEEWHRVLDVNLGGTFFACQAAARVMVARDGGAIVNVASELALVADGNHAGYIASKAGVAGLTRALAVEWGPLGIRVNAVAPGLTRTPMTADMAEADREDYRTRTPDRRLAEPEDIAEAVLFLVSDASRHVAGQLLVVDGGYTIT